MQSRRKIQILGVKESTRMGVLQVIRELLPTTLRAEVMTTANGELYWPNTDLILGPKFLIRLNFPLSKERLEWESVQPYLGGADEAVVHRFFSECNGFSFGRRFAAFGIIRDGAYGGAEFDWLNTPYDLRGNSYGSYPQYAPTKGYFISELHPKDKGSDICDVVIETGEIVSGRFRESETVLERFGDLESWLAARVPVALDLVRVDWEKSQASV